MAQPAPRVRGHVRHRVTRPSHIMRCSPLSPMDDRRSAAIPPAETASTLRCLRGLGVSIEETRRRQRPHTHHRGPVSAACPPLPTCSTLQFRGSDADARRHSGRPPLPGHDDRRRLLCAAGRCDESSCPGAHGRRIGSEDGRPRFRFRVSPHSSQSSFHPRCPARRSNRRVAGRSACKRCHDRP